MNEDREITASLARMGLLDEPAAIHSLSGGVSCDVWRVDMPGRTLCLKRALAKLRVSADWQAPVERSQAEVAWFRLVKTIDPALVPKIMGEDRAKHMFAMEYLSPDLYPLWKAQLAEGRIDAGFAAKVGSALARIHAATAHKAHVAKQFDHGAQFRALRLEPYLLYTAGRHPDLAPAIAAAADAIAASRIALMHGDVSPKNILCGPLGPVFLDAETACYGDPAFDLAFCLNHLLLKCVWHPEYRHGYLQSFANLASAYRGRVMWEEPAALAWRTARLLPILLLARIDGKSPVEYIAGEAGRAFVRTFARQRILVPPTNLEALAGEWNDYFDGSRTR